MTYSETMMSAIVAIDNKIYTVGLCDYLDGARVEEGEVFKDGAALLLHERSVAWSDQGRRQRKKMEVSRGCCQVQ